jgi:putative DNA primase/helicase
VDRRVKSYLSAMEPEPHLEEPRLVAVTAAELLTMEFPQREMVLDPIIPTQGLVMIHSVRGVGKTYLGLGIAYAVATGTEFLYWKAPQSRKVVYVDGEMPAVSMQERLLAIVAGAEGSGPPSEDCLRIINPDLQDCPIPTLASIDGQLAIEAEMGDAELLVLDNISTLCGTHIGENEAGSWTSLQQWLLSLRRRGVSVLLKHHSGKGGLQRGTSRREDVLDTVLALRHPNDYSPEEGLRLEVHIEKGRGIHGINAEPFEVRMETPEGRAIWTTRKLAAARETQVKALIDLGMSMREIEEETGIPKSVVHRIKQKMEKE